jgi:hypothetical protein
VALLLFFLAGLSLGLITGNREQRLMLLLAYALFLGLAIWVTFYNPTVPPLLHVTDL